MQGDAEPEQEPVPLRPAVAALVQLPRAFDVETQHLYLEPLRLRSEISLAWRNARSYRWRTHPRVIERRSETKRVMASMHNSLSGMALYYRNFGRRHPEWGQIAFPPIRGREWPLCFIERWAQIRFCSQVIGHILAETAYILPNEAICLTACVSQINKHSSIAARFYFIDLLLALELDPICTRRADDTDDYPLPPAHPRFL